jgi:hypothetical protein
MKNQKKPLMHQQQKDYSTLIDVATNPGLLHVYARMNMFQTGHIVPERLYEAFSPCQF